MVQTNTEMQAELQTRLNDCFTRIAALEQKTVENQEKLSNLTTILGKVNIEIKTQIPALFKPKELELT